jgi:hypothetical protein
MREVWRELNTVSQAYVAVWFGKKNYKVRGKSDAGVQRKRSFNDLTVPLGLTLLDPLKVVPCGNFLFGMEQLAYYADPTEKDVIDSWILGDDASGADPIVKRLILAKYEPDFRDRKEIGNLGVDPNRLYVLNPKYVWRHTSTRPGFNRFASVRMKSIFEVLDLKHQLRQMDRAHLVGGPLRVDQRIPTADGWKPIGAAQVGDKVYSVDGQLTDIIGVFPQGKLPMYRVTFTDGAEVYCDPSHPWTVRDRSGRERTIRLEQIIAEGLWDSNGPGKRIARHRIPITQALNLPERDLPLDPYLLGYMLGDGSLTQSIPKITCAELDDQPWRDVLPEGVTVSQYENRPGFCPQYGLKGSRWRYNEVTEGLRGCGVWGMVDEDKFIPDEYLWASSAQRWALLQGLCDSDGHSPKAGGVEFSTISEKLALGMVHLVQSLGGVAKIGVRKGVAIEPGVFDIAPCCAEKGEQKGYKHVGEGWCAYCGEPLDGVATQERKQTRTLYRVWLSLHQTEAPFRLSRKIQRWKPRKVPYVRAFAKVERVDDAEAVCIKTAREDGLFLTEGMVVTHNTNFIVLIKKGTDKEPAKPAEIGALTEQVKVIGSTPLIVGDHRLNIEIVTPKTDNTLDAKRYQVVDSRISGRLYGMFLAQSGEHDDALKLARVVAKGFESRRHMMRRSFMRNVIIPTYELNDALKAQPKIEFHPKRIQLDFDPALATYLLDLRDRGDLSRASILSEVDYDEADEALRRRVEKEKYDDVFAPPAPALPAPVPGAVKAPAKPAPAPGAPNDPKRAGRSQGGNHNGGGSASGRGAGQAPRRGTPKDPVKPSKASEEFLDDVDDAQDE